MFTFKSNSGKEYSTKFKKNIKLEKKVVNLAEEGMSYVDMAKKLKVNKRNLLRIAHKHGIRRNNKFDTLENRALVAAINKDIEAGLPYKELIKKHNLTLDLRGRLSRIGLEPVTKKYKERRDGEIVSQYKNKIAKKVLASDDKVLDSPERIVTEHNIYIISSQMGFKKYPKIINRNKGGCFEDRKIISYIIRKRDKDEWSFKKISDKLNKLGKKTLTGKDFQWHSVAYKYKHNKSLRKKNKKKSL